jgi:hypothetical protein
VREGESVAAILYIFLYIHETNNDVNDLVWAQKQGERQHLIRYEEFGSNRARSTQKVVRSETAFSINTSMHPYASIH